MENNINWIEESGLCVLVRVVCDYSESRKEYSTSKLMNMVYLHDDRLQFQEYLPLENAFFHEAYDLLDDMFLEDGIKQQLQDQILRTEVARAKLLASVNPQEPFPEEENINSYLEAYYCLLRSCFAQIDTLSDSWADTRRFIQCILNVDMVLGSEDAHASLYAPAVLDGIFHLYKSIDEYRRCVADVKSCQIRQNYQEVLVSKILRYFRWIVICDGEMMQAAIPASLTETDSDRFKRAKWSLNVPVRSLQSYNSFEGIGELRLLDKVLYEIDCRKNEKRLGNEFHITLVGDVQSEPMKLLCRLTRLSLEQQSDLPESLRITFRVLTYHRDARGSSADGGTDNKLSVDYHFERYDRHLANMKKLNEIIDSSDLLFVLDSCDLYRQISVNNGNENHLMRQRIARDDYRMNCLSSGNEEKMIRKSNFTDLIQMLYVFSYTGETGKLYKRLNRTILSHLWKRGSEEYENGRSIYVYISDLDAFKAVDYDERQLIRIERYNEKEIAILRMSDYEEKPLPVGRPEEERMIVFTLWQLIKHTAARNIKGFMQFFDFNDDKDILILRNTMIGVDYSDWPNTLEFYYELPDVKRADFETKVRSCLEEQVVPFFKRHTSDMFYEYFVKSFSSFLYSDAKNVDDMLFLYLFTNQHDSLRQARLAGRRVDLKRFRPKQCKYSQKQYYLEVMDDYDTSSEMFAFKYWKLEHLEKADPDLRKKIFKNIKGSCERNSYTESYLYEKCRRMSNGVV